MLPKSHRTRCLQRPHKRPGGQVPVGHDSDQAQGPSQNTRAVSVHILVLKDAQTKPSRHIDRQHLHLIWVANDLQHTRGIARNCIPRPMCWAVSAPSALVEHIFGCKPHCNHKSFTWPMSWLYLVHLNSSKPHREARHYEFITPYSIFYSGSYGWRWGSQHFVQTAVQLQWNNLSCTLPSRPTKPFCHLREVRWNTWRIIGRCVEYPMCRSASGPTHLLDVLCIHYVSHSLPNSLARMSLRPCRPCMLGCYSDCIIYRY